MMHYAIVLGLVSCLSAVSAGVLPLPANKIVGGNVVSIEEIGYQVSLNFYGAHRCGGSILSNKFILTAAHCTPSETDGREEFFTVRAGSNYSETEGQVLQVEKIHRHELYDPESIDYDFSIVELKDDIVFSYASRPIHLPRAGDDIENGAILTISGWGATKNTSESSYHVRAVDIPKVDQSECITSYETHGAITDRMFCAGYPEGGKDSCQGDSGGPVVKNGFYGQVLVGVVSWGKGCALPGYPGVYSKVSSVRDWIHSVTDL
uniref:trypsin n=1 Tax=Phlebotomus papatasi TaxID=29031 RepID=A0A1B0DQX3_PHLPP